VDLADYFFYKNKVVVGLLVLFFAVFYIWVQFLFMRV